MEELGPHPDFGLIRFSDMRYDAVALGRVRTNDP